MNHGWNPSFDCWMGRRHGWRGFVGPGRPGREFGFFASLFGEPGPRAERGGVKYLVLDAVAEAPRHGYEIMQVIEERSKGGYRPSPGVIYPTLQLLEEMGLVRGSEKEGRKVYEITEAGRRELEANRETVRDFYAQQDEAPWEVYGDELMRIQDRHKRQFALGPTHEEIITVTPQKSPLRIQYFFRAAFSETSPQLPLQRVGKLCATPSVRDALRTLNRPAPVTHPAALSLSYP